MRRDCVSFQVSAFKKGDSKSFQQSQQREGFFKDFWIGNSWKFTGGNHVMRYRISQTEAQTLGSKYLVVAKLVQKHHILMFVDVVLMFTLW